jgi:hypothetical protein
MTRTAEEIKTRLTQNAWLEQPRWELKRDFYTNSLAALQDFVRLDGTSLTKGQAVFSQYTDYAAWTNADFAWAGLAVEITTPSDITLVCPHASPFLFAIARPNTHGGSAPWITVPCSTRRGRLRTSRVANGRIQRIDRRRIGGDGSGAPRKQVHDLARKSIAAHMKGNAHEREL